MIRFIRQRKLRSKMKKVKEGDGLYKGGMQGGQGRNWRKMTFNGMDILFVEDGMIKDYWVSSDGVSLMEQLGILSLPIDK
ncbi:hypothetical protein [Oceanobacillus picturae]|uniref:hypothetical protein n=1 Tax=Oceanobacillus picturae TaxID=171693 RepID=UPI00363ED622